MWIVPTYPPRRPGDRNHPALFWKNARANPITLQISRVEIHNFLGTGDSYHAPLRMLFTLLSLKNPAQFLETYLTLTLKGMNSNMGRSGVVPTTLVFRAVRSLPIASTAYHKQAMELVALSCEHTGATVLPRVPQQVYNWVLILCWSTVLYRYHQMENLHEHGRFVPCSNSSSNFYPPFHAAFEHTIYFYSV